MEEISFHVRAGWPECKACLVSRQMDSSLNLPHIALFFIFQSCDFKQTVMSGLHNWLCGVVSAFLLT